ncbi:MAG: carbamoyltransferase HypF [Planctomycetaceae bacterium]|nr:carbamoyltransferase HypF [Planctomycetaceae bacterium]
MSVKAVSAPSRVAKQIMLTGLVQGVGMRPAIARLARQLGLTGYVANDRTGVEIHVEGEPEPVDEFCGELLNAVPRNSLIQSESISTAELLNVHAFSIVRQNGEQNLSSSVPLDLATCAECMSEFWTAGDTRHEYALISCTGCGPRYSVIRNMPFEREQTTLREFSLCTRCTDEHESLDNRRAHAQTMSCPDCGPNIWFESDDAVIRESSAAIQAAAHLIRLGKILALCGVGGYQLLVDATSNQAVAQLRVRKQRARKPFAMMVADEETAAGLAQFDDQGFKLLRSAQNPIVLLNKSSGTDVAENVAPGQSTLGLMLPTTPIHAELCRLCSVPVVATSGNLDGNPLEHDPDSSRRHLVGIADGFLHHNREIIRPIDDSVVRPMAQGRVTIRNARGLAPLTFPVVTRSSILAVGGQQKSSIALSNGGQSVLGPHVGNLNSLAMCRQFENHIASMLQLYDMVPDVLVHDLHPDYYSTRWALQQGSQTMGVQHHHAHIVSGMLEHGRLDDEVLGLALDGTGYGRDKTIWGGEYVLATATDFSRVGHLTPFRLPGGDLVVSQPWRTAVSLLAETFDANTAASVANRIFPELPTQNVLQLAKSENLSPVTTSLGRLLDGVTSLITGQAHADYEAELPMMLESLASESVSVERGYEFHLRNGVPFQICWRNAVRSVLSDLTGGVSQSRVAARFLNGLIDGLVRPIEKFPGRTIVLAGGCFQNRLLLDGVVSRIRQQGRDVVWPQRIPINDGGLAAGQLAIAAARLGNVAAVSVEDSACV